MENFFMGLLVGIILCALGGFLAMPSIKQTAHDAGVAEGTKAVWHKALPRHCTGYCTSEGPSKCKSEQDSTVAAQRYQAARRKAAAARKVAPKPKPAAELACY